MNKIAKFWIRLCFLFNESYLIRIRRPFLQCDALNNKYERKIQREVCKGWKISLELKLSNLNLVSRIKLMNFVVLHPSTCKHLKKIGMTNHL
jgi:hypothetical protein